MKKVNVFLVGLVTLVTLGIGFSSCGGGGSSNSGSSNSGFAGTYVGYTLANQRGEVRIVLNADQTATYSFAGMDTRTSWSTWSPDGAIIGMNNSVIRRYDGNFFYFTSPDAARAKSGGIRMTRQ